MCGVRLRNSARNEISLNFLSRKRIYGMKGCIDGCVGLMVIWERAVVCRDSVELIYDVGFYHHLLIVINIMIRSAYFLCVIRER